MSLGIVAISTSVATVSRAGSQSGWLVLAALTLLTGTFSIKLPGVNARISVSEAFVFTTVLLFGAAPATLVVTLDTLVLTSWKGGSARSRLRGLFNMTAGAVAIWSASQFYSALLPSSAPPTDLEHSLFPVLGLATCYFAINSLLVAVAVGFESRRSPIAVWRANFAWLSLSYLGGASVAALLVTYTKGIDLTILSVIVPILLITYLTFRTSLGRLDDAHRHVAQVNELYFSTIEALAMAVDAKDQITHGHIRRVQHYAVALAKQLGVADPQQLKAIEAAALLHDMGKLAIPEHILNKPGKLSVAEFETMKTHATIGAELLSTIPFPYPVVPIVRHHHEQWDGGGYPDGLAGTDIPLGARILSVVDCFDALNSDRPYRPRLTLQESFQILAQRRGTMYDSLVVDAFVELYPRIAAEADLAGENARSLTKPLIAETANRPDFAPANHGRSSNLADARLVVLNAAGLDGAFAGLARQLVTRTGARVVVFYRYSVEDDVLKMTFTSNGDPRTFLTTIALGKRISGWVGSSRQTAFNLRSELELPETNELCGGCTLSTPLMSGSHLLGVITAYSSPGEVFEESSAKSLELLGAVFAERLANELTAAA